MSAQIFDFESTPQRVFNRNVAWATMGQGYSKPAALAIARNIRRMVSEGMDEAVARQRFCKPASDDAA